MNLDEVIALDIVPSSAWTFLIGMRDNFICQDCGKKLHYMSHELKAHHIIPISKIISDKMDASLIKRLSNGIAVCSQCHANRHNHKNNFIALLPANTTILSNSIILQDGIEYVRVNEACKLGHLNPETLGRLDAHKLLPNKEIAHRKYYRKDQLLQFAELLNEARKHCNKRMSQQHITEEVIAIIQQMTQPPNIVKTEKPQELKPNKDTTLTLEQVANLLRVSKPTMLKIVKTGKIGKKFGKQWRFKREEIDNYKGDNND